MTSHAAELRNAVQESNHARLIFELQKQAHLNDPYPDLSCRLDRLSRLKCLLIENKDSIAEAINADFGGRSSDETMMFDIMMPVQYINYNLKHLKKWMAPQKRHLGLHMQPASAKVIYQPLGVVGIIGAWNYPIFLAAGPLAPVIAAGNRAMIKMSEHNPKSAELFQRLINEYFSEQEVSVITGGVDVAQELIGLDLDHIMFTGSSRVGAEIMKTASSKLTPVTLELGGKSPAIISPSASFADAALRICHGKTANGGQTCVAPDYVFIPKGKKSEFIGHIKAAYNNLYPQSINSPDYTAIINPLQLKRLKAMVTDARAKGATVESLGNENDIPENKLPLHLVVDPNKHMQCMQDEIFGPVLPIVEYQDIHEVFKQVNSGAKPLAAYYFGTDQNEIMFVERSLHAGGITINDCMFHAALDDAPFGGVGASGMGQYHGKEGFIQFSNAKTVLSKAKLNTSGLLYPPFGKKIHKLIYSYLIR